MNLEEDDDGEFSIPTEMVDKLYELSGGADKYKGIIMAASSEKSQIVSFTLPSPTVGNSIDYKRYLFNFPSLKVPVLTSQIAVYHGPW